MSFANVEPESGLRTDMESPTANLNRELLDPADASREPIKKLDRALTGQMDEDGEKTSISMTLG